VTERKGTEIETETVTETGTGEKGTGTRGTRTEKGRENERKTGRGSVNGSETGIVMEDEIVGTGIEGTRGTGRNALRLESLRGNRGTRVGSLRGNLLPSQLQRQPSHPLDLQIPHPGIGLIPRVRTDWVSDEDLLTTT
jgi:hypothetical protein